MSLIEAFRNLTGTNNQQSNQQSHQPNGIPNNQPGMINPNQPGLPNMSDINNQIAAGQQQQTQQQAAEKSPSELLAELWKIEPAKDAQPGLTAPTLNIDPVKLQQLSQAMDFTKGTITQQDMEKVVAGGPEAMQVLLKAVNATAQNTYSQSIAAAAKLVDASLAQNTSNLQQALPGVVKTQQMHNAINASSPVFTDPAVAPIMQMLTAQLVKAYPNATTDEITKHAQAAVLNIGKVVAPGVSQTQQQQEKQDSGVPPNWLEYLTK
jgi:hypothetical protein